MRTILTVVAFGLVSAMATLLTDARQESKPIKEHTIGTYFKAPPDTLKQMALDADAVVRGRIVGSAARDAKNDVLTAFRLKVDEVIHAFGGRPVDAPELFVLRRTGDRDRGEHIERTVQEGFPAFEHGHEYVVYLMWNEALNGWVPAFGPDSVVDITRGVVDSPGHAKVTLANKNRSAEDYLKSVRRLEQ